MNNKVYLIDPNLSFKEKMKYINTFVFRAFLISVFLVFIIFVLFMFIYFGDLLFNVKQGKYKNPIYSAYIIVSGSMVPTINIQDGIFVRRNNNLDIGDIITFSSVDKKSYGLKITHRIVGKERLSNGIVYYKTKGDHNRFVDTSLVSLDKIYGKVMVKFPKLGYIYNFIKTPLGLVICLIIPIILIVFINLNTIKLRSY